MVELPGQQIKQKNLNHIRKLMRRFSTATKTQLAKESKLSTVTLGSLMSELTSNNEVTVDRLMPSRGGRPAQVYRFNADYAHALGLYVLQTSQVYMLYTITVDLQGKILSSERAILESEARNQIVAIAKEKCHHDSLIKSISVGIPGQALHSNILFCDVADLVGDSLYEMLKTATKQEIVIENDMNAAVYGYADRACLDDNECTVSVYFPMGMPPGGGILLGQRLIRGKMGMAGEISSLPISVNWKNPDQPIEEIIALFIQIINALLAPDRIVVYRENLNQDHLSKAIKKNCQNQHSLPEIIADESLERDYMLGIKKLALSPLLPKQSSF